MQTQYLNFDRLSRAAVGDRERALSDTEWILVHCSALRTAFCVNKFLQAISETPFETFAGAVERSVSREFVVMRFRFRSSIQYIEYERMCASTCMRLLEWFAVLSNWIEKLSSTVNCLTLIWSILSKMPRLSYRASIAIRDEFCQRNLLSDDLMTKTVQFRCQNRQKFSNLQVLAWSIVTHSLKVTAISAVSSIWRVNIFY